MLQRHKAALRRVCHGARRARPKIVVITGASAGVGRATVRAFAKGQVGHGEMIASLTHLFAVPEAEGAEAEDSDSKIDGASEPVDLGELRLESRSAAVNGTIPAEKVKPAASAKP